MSDFLAIEQGLQEYLASQSILTDLLSNIGGEPSVFVYPAPPACTAPYICIFKIDLTPDDTHDSRGERVLFQISVFAVRTSLADEICGALDSVLHWQTFLIDNYNTLAVKRVRGPAALYLEPDEELVGLSVDYEVTVQE